MAASDTYLGLLKCSCMLTYSDFKEWLGNVTMDNTLRAQLLSQVLQTGTLSYNNWVLLLNALTYLEHDAAYFIKLINTCGYLCMEDLIPAIHYTGEPMPTVGEFSPEFSSEFN